MERQTSQEGGELIYSNYRHHADEETEAQSGEFTSLRSQSKPETE